MAVFPDLNRDLSFSLIPEVRYGDGKGRLRMRMGYGNWVRDGMGWIKRFRKYEIKTGNWFGNGKDGD